MWAQSGHMAWHMTTLDTQTWLSGELPRLGLTNEDVGRLRGGWIVIVGCLHPSKVLKNMI
jgi:hypothetical protein